MMRQITIVALMGIVALGQPAMAQKQGNIGPLGEASIILNRYHISSPKRAQLESGAIKGMIADLNDPYARYISPEGYLKIKARERGLSVGIGATLGYIDGTLGIISVLPGGPAERAGLAPMDMIEQINRVPTAYLSVAEANSMLQGQPKTKVTIVIRRPHIAKPVPISVTRKAMANRSISDVQVFYNTVGYLKLSTFTYNTAKEFREALIQINKRGIRSLILDLRNNGGGQLDQAIRIARYLFHEGTIMRISAPNSRKQISAVNAAIFAVKPMVVLVNRSTASASEILAAALQDNKRAVIMGQPTFGKATVQRLFPLADGSAIIVTVANYYTPAGTNLEGRGVMPDKIIQIPEHELAYNSYQTSYATDTVLQNAIDYALLVTQ